jgi:ParB/RepB/Spo0J family partition protein
MFEILPIDKIVPARDNVRRRLGDVRDLAASVASVGIVEPLLVCPADQPGHYVVVAGHRRLEAARRAGLTDVPCTVRELSDAERVEIMLAENIARSALSPIEEASGYFRLIEFGVTLAEMARKIGRSARHINGRLALLELPRKVQAAVDSGELTVGDATALLAFKDDPEVIERLLKDEWSRHNVERAVVREGQKLAAAAQEAEAREALTAEGVTVVDGWSRYGGRSGQPVAVGDRVSELDVPVGRHRREPCHAAHVMPGGEVVHLCTDPARHRLGGDSRLQAPAAAAPTRSEECAEERAAARRQREADRERRALLSGLLRQRLPKADIWSVVCAQYVAGAGSAQAKTACSLLGLDPAEGRYGPDHRLALEEFAAASALNHGRTVLALALAAGEDAMRFASHVPPSSAATAHMEFLCAYGWPADARGSTEPAR